MNTLNASARVTLAHEILNSAETREMSWKTSPIIEVPTPLSDVPITPIVSEAGYYTIDLRTAVVMRAPVFGEMVFYLLEFAWNDSIEWAESVLNDQRTVN